MTKQELATRIWATANVLRKNIKASEYKDYILGFMFYKYLCDKQMDYLISIGGESLSDLKDADDDMKSMFKEVNGYFIAHDDMFEYWKGIGNKLGAKNVSEALDRFYTNLHSAYNSVFNKVFSALQTGLSNLGDNSGSRDKAVRDIVELVALIPPTSKDFDVLGYIYEYLIQQFSSEAKKDGAFYTPHELTSLMAKITAERMKGRTEIKAYDPTVGSGGLLLNIGREIGKYVDKNSIHYYGQELITETANLAKMNLFMQGVPVQNICINCANTLEDDWPYFEENGGRKPLPVDVVVSNPPYSAHWTSSSYKTDPRFVKYGLAPDTKADYAFLLHCLYHLKNDGVMAIVLPHGVLFRGGSEEEIRKKLIENHNIETVIGFPSQMFFATPISVIVAVLSKERKESDILFVDASQSFVKVKKQNVLRQMDIQKIFDAVQERKSIPNFSRLVTKEEIKKNDYNLNIPRYVSARKEESPYDLFSVMTGQISKAEVEQFKEFWEKFPGLREKLFIENDTYYDITDDNLRKVIVNYPAVVDFTKEFKGVSAEFKSYLIEELLRRSPAQNVMETIKKQLFVLFGDKKYKLIDKYSVYQSFADCWDDIEGDISRISSEGKQICMETEPWIVMKKDSKTKKFVEDQIGMKGKIFPLELIKNAYFKEDFSKIKTLSADADGYVSDYTELWEDFDEDIIAELSKEGDDNTDFDIKKIKAAIKKAEFPESTIRKLKAIVKAVDSEKACSKRIKELDLEIKQKAEDKIHALSDEEVFNLLVMKWIDPIIFNINKTAENVITGFAADIVALKEKYADPLSELSTDLENTEKQLHDMLSDLVGNTKDMDAIRMLKTEFEVNPKEETKCGQK